MALVQSESWARKLNGAQLSFPDWHLKVIKLYIIQSLIREYPKQMSKMWAVIYSNNGVVIECKKSAYNNSTTK